MVEPELQCCRSLMCGCVDRRLSGNTALGTNSKLPFSRVREHGGHARSFLTGISGAFAVSGRALEPDASKVQTLWLFNLRSVLRQSLLLNVLLVIFGVSVPTHPPLWSNKPTSKEG
jgi:hypothetical protein